MHRTRIVPGTEERAGPHDQRVSARGLDGGLRVGLAAAVCGQRRHAVVLAVRTSSLAIEYQV
jgi:hypothetical protein